MRLSNSGILFRTLIAITLCGTVLTVKAQDDRQKSYIIEQRVEQIAEANEDLEIDYTTMFDQLAWFFEHPINLNNASEKDLQDLRLLTDQQILNLFTHIEKNGKLMSLYELQTIDGWDATTILNVLPFVKVSADLNAPNITFKDMIKNGSNELFIRYTRILEEQEGFAPIEDSVLAESPNKRYLGSEDKIYMRYRFKFRQNVSWGMTAEKDAGEEFFKGTQKNGFDFYSAHLYLQDFGPIKALALGDFQVQFGQGLTAWSGLAFGKSSSVMNVKRQARGLRPYTSVDENLFMRGAGVTVGVKDFELTTFFSKKRIDANISEGDTLEQEVVVTSFQTSGIHGTPGELFDKDAIGEQHMGGHLAFKKRRLEIGVTAMASDYDGDLQRTLREYNQFDFNDNKNLSTGLDYNFIVNNFNFYGEASRSLNGGMAFLNGALITLDRNLSMSIMHRHYGRDYQQLVSNAFAENSRTVNERGLYVGMQATHNRRWTFYGYFDLFTFPWMRSDLETPEQSGYDHLAQLNWKPSKKLEIYGRIRSRLRPTDTDDDIDDIDFRVSRKQINYRLNVSTKISEDLRLKNRVEMVRYEEGNNDLETGFLVYQDILYQKKGSPLSIKLRYALFDVQSYDARVYAYENDVLYFFSIPAYANRGSRFYTVLRYKVARGVDLWLRYSQWLYNDRETISSGLTGINSNTKSEIRAQVRFRF